MKKIAVEIPDEIYDYLEKRAKELNEEIKAEIITAEDIAAGILMRVKERDDEDEKRNEEIK